MDPLRIISHVMRAFFKYETYLVTTKLTCGWNIYGPFQHVRELGQWLNFRPFEFNVYSNIKFINVKKISLLQP